MTDPFSSSFSSQLPPAQPSPGVVNTTSGAPVASGGPVLGSGPKRLQKAFPSSPQAIGVLLALLGLWGLVAALGSAFTASSVGGWYMGITKPLFTPPNWVFGPAWSLLYLLLTGLGYLVWVGQQNTQVPLPWFWRAYFASALLQTAWSGLFFGLHWLWFSAVVLVLTVALAGVMGWALWTFNRKLALGLSPYVAWLLFASAISTTTAWLN